MKKISVMFALVLALSFGLASCGSAPEDFTPNFVGTWDLVQIEDENNALSQEDLDLLKEMNMVCTLNLDEGGSFSLDMFGDTVSGTWEATSAETISLTMEGSVVEATLANERLSMEQAGAGKLVFAKHSAASSQEVSSGAAALADAATSGDAADGAASTDAESSEANTADEAESSEAA